MEVADSMGKATAIWSLESASCTAQGRRAYQQDAFLNAPESGLFVVADGCGGHTRGDLASQLVVEHLAATATDQPLPEAITGANEVLLRHGRRDPSVAGMATTVVAAQVTTGGLLVAWVGDSRAYVVREGELFPVTLDHTHPSGALANVIGYPDMAVETVLVPSRSGDRVILCSDGLTKEVGDAELEALVRAPRAVGELAQALVTRALTNGGHDNVTVIVVHVDEVRARGEGTRPRRRPRGAAPRRAR